MARSALISGMGVAGPTLAYWLTQHGWRTTLVEHATAFRRGGYVIDFWGTGYDVAERMGLLPALCKRGYSVREVRLVGDDGRRVGGFDVDVMRRALQGRFVSILRGDLADELFRSVRMDAEVLFDDSVEHLADDGSGVDVDLARGGQRRFDLVVGADGLHSRVRELVFGPEDRFLRYLGYCAAAFTVAHYPRHDEDVYVGYSCPGREIARFSLRDGGTVFYLIFEAVERPGSVRFDVAAQKAYLHAEYAGVGWEWPVVGRALDACNDLFFDPVAQIQMDAWHRGRVALVGDAAFGPSLLAGEGASLAMAASYVLAGELARSPEDVEGALIRYQALLAGMMREKQRAAAKFGKWFAPSTRAGVALRNLVSRSLSLPIVGDAMARRMLQDSVDVPGYA